MSKLSTEKERRQSILDNTNGIINIKNNPKVDKEARIFGIVS